MTKKFSFKNPFNKSLNCHKIESIDNERPVIQRHTIAREVLSTEIYTYLLDYRFDFESPITT